VQRARILNLCIFLTKNAFFEHVEKGVGESIHLCWSCARISYILWIYTDIRRKGVFVYPRVFVYPQNIRSFSACVRISAEKLHVSKKKALHIYERVLHICKRALHTSAALQFSCGVLVCVSASQQVELPALPLYVYRTAKLGYIQGSFADIKGSFADM